MKTEKHPSFAKRVNLLPKIVCLLAAFVIWIYVMEVDSPDHEETFEDVPVAISGITNLDDKNLSVFSGQDTVVDVTVKGQKSVIAKSSVSDIAVTADVSKIDAAGSYSLSLDFDLPSGLTFSQSSLTELKLFIDKRTSDNKNIKLNPYNYQVPSGYELGEITCDIDTVSVTGAESVLKEVSYAQVDVNLSGNNITESFTTDGTISLYDSADNPVENKYIKLSQSTAKVSIPVYTSKEVKLTASTKYGYYKNSNTEISINPPTVTVKGDPSVINSLEEIPVTVLNEKNIKEDSKLTVDISLPEGVLPVVGQPQTADVNIKFKNMMRRSLTVKTVNVKNAKNVKYEVMTNNVAVDLFGESAAIKALSADNISLTVDLEAYEKGAMPGMIYPLAEVSFSKVNGVVYELGTYNIQILIG